jgi:Na+-transporting methylmalonyl-CoA/oxaloacetate decarboxylase beta subunit
VYERFKGNLLKKIREKKLRVLAKPERTVFGIVCYLNIPALSPSQNPPKGLLCII